MHAFQSSNIQNDSCVAIQRNVSIHRVFAGTVVTRNHLKSITTYLIVFRIMFSSTAYSLIWFVLVMLSPFQHTRSAEVQHPLFKKDPHKKNRWNKQTLWTPPAMTSWHGLVCRENLFTKMSHPGRLTWNLKITQWKSGKSSSKPSFSGSMIIFRGVHHGFMWPMVWLGFDLPLKSRDYLDWQVATPDAASSLKGGCSQKKVSESGTQTDSLVTIPKLGGE